MQKVISTLVTVVVAVGASAVIWIAANLLFNQVRHRWARFAALSLGGAGFVLGVLLAGNRLTVGSEGGFVNWVWLPVVAAATFAAIGVVLARTDDPGLRRLVGTFTGLVVGTAIGLLVREEYRPALEAGPLIGWTAGGVVAGGALSAVRRRPPLHGALLGGALGWVLGTWGSAQLGDGSLTETLVAAIVPGVLVGARLGTTSNPAFERRVQVDRSSRAVIFLVPALLFIFVTLVVPSVRTIYLSVLDADSEKYVALKNYGATFADPGSWDTSNWTTFFTSRLFFIAVGLLAVTAVVGVVMKRRTGRMVELGSPTVPPLVVAAVLLAFALFTALRGTIVNNLWWVVTVTFASTALGLAVAVLADNARLEKVAKSIIFMPMAISLVGASIIWRFMYLPRDTSGEQTGTLNALWVGLGRLSTGGGIPTLLVGALLGLVLLGLLVALIRRLVQRRYTAAVVPGSVALLLGWFLFRYAGSGVGGYRTAENGEVVARTIEFINERPYNNVWLMVIMIWIQTGFAMVILSAALKAVPPELIEAARVDGASRSQIFWQVTLPQIATTIGVVVTTLVVVVMKVFDIVKVVTNGGLGTQVLANNMFDQAFDVGNTGQGAALAVLIFVSVLPVMYFNIRRMQREG